MKFEIFETPSVSTALPLFTSTRLRGSILSRLGRELGSRHQYIDGISLTGSVSRYVDEELDSGEKNGENVARLV